LPPGEAWAATWAPRPAAASRCLCSSHRHHEMQLPCGHSACVWRVAPRAFHHPEARGMSLSPIPVPPPTLVRYLLEAGSLLLCCAGSFRLQTMQLVATACRQSPHDPSMPVGVGERPVPVSERGTCQRKKGWRAFGLCWVSCWGATRGWGGRGQLVGVRTGLSVFSTGWPRTSAGAQAGPRKMT
jgi:hypothetical protein